MNKLYEVVLEPLIDLLRAYPGLAPVTALFVIMWNLSGGEPSVFSRAIGEMMNPAPSINGYEFVTTHAVDPNREEPDGNKGSEPHQPVPLELPMTPPAEKRTIKLTLGNGQEQYPAYFFRLEGGPKNKAVPYDDMMKTAVGLVVECKTGEGSLSGLFDKELRFGANPNSLSGKQILPGNLPDLKYFRNRIVGADLKATTPDVVIVSDLNGLDCDFYRTATYDEAEKEKAKVNDVIIVGDYRMKDYLMWSLFGVVGWIVLSFVPRLSGKLQSAQSSGGDGQAASATDEGAPRTPDHHSG